MAVFGQLAEKWWFVIAGTKIEVLFSRSRICGKQLRFWIAHCQKRNQNVALTVVSN